MATEPIPVRRHIVKVGRRRVHLRLAGKGPPLLLLHQSPRSSAEYLDLLQQWGQHFTCIAPDTPGFGQSDPLAEDWFDMDQLADATVALLDALRLPSVAVFGIHTGAIIAVTAAARHPERFSALVANGYAVWTRAEVKVFTTSYLWPLVPDWAGQHVQWAWQRIREQNLFFPWHRQEEATWMGLPLKAPADLHAQVIDLLAAGDTYRAGYRAAFLARPACAAQLACPSLLIADKTDPLHRHLPRLPKLKPHVKTALTDTRPHVFAQSLAFLLDHQAKPSNFRLPLAPEHRFIDVEVTGWSGAVHLRHSGKPGGATLTVHPPGQSARIAQNEGCAAGWVLDLPGHGLSDPLARPLSLAALAEIVIQVLRALAGADIAIRAVESRGISAALLLALAGHDDLPRGITLSATDAALPPPAERKRWQAAILPDLAAKPDGTHLITAWQAIHDSALFLPWFEARPAARRPLGPLAPHALNEALVDLFNASGARACADSLLAADLDALAGKAQKAVTLTLPRAARGRTDLWQPPAGSKVKLRFVAAATP